MQQPQTSVFRPERYFHVVTTRADRSGWFCETREGLRGPFFSKRDAQLDLMKLIHTRPKSRTAV